MNRDITTEDDVKKVIDDFTESVEKDSLLSRYFAHVNWSEQKPLMQKFWSSFLFTSDKFTGRPLPKHVVLQGLGETHFNKITELFVNAINNYFSGTRANLFKIKIKQICLVYESKLMLMSEDD